ncbi:EC protein III-like [Syzygium oleosum]|uniref:EC protein III-like n=1 Tax=Syzygium oleosum TaxID=219896 RepID=UPI0011D2902F|nr:EC protein III-like [Syzygium oleosum]
MSDLTAGTCARAAACNDRCGCSYPCTGSASCRCATSGTEAGGMDPKKCSCGDHCGCNPCSCGSATAAAGTGRANCRCGPGCTCVTCAT